MNITEALKQQNKKLAIELELTDKLLKQQYRVMDAIPGCPVHGNRCVPHAVEWVLWAKLSPSRRPLIAADVSV